VTGAKRCATCKGVKPLSEYTSDRRRPGGLHYECRECARQRRDGSRVRTHGYSGYGYGCRCEVCRAAKAAYMAARRRAAYLADHPVPEGIRHATRSAYEEHGCRCEPCTAAERNSTRWRARARAS
jgi:hypothetical protein